MINRSARKTRTARRPQAYELLGEPEGVEKGGGGDGISRRIGRRLALYLPDILPVHGPKDAETRDVLELRSVDARISHLRRVPLLVDCTDEELHRIAAIARIVETPTGTLLTEMGTPGDSFFFLIDGRVSVQTPLGGAGPLHPGDFFGEMSPLDGATISHGHRDDGSPAAGR